MNSIDPISAGDAELRAAVQSAPSAGDAELSSKAHSIDDLFLSGGGFRAALGSAGAVAYLAHERRWNEVDAKGTCIGKVNRVTSVSGGSLLNGALVAGGSDDVHDVLRRFIGDIRRDRARPWGTKRRLLICVVFLVGVLAMPAAVVVLARLNAFAAVVGGVLMMPTLLFMFRRFFADFTADLARVATKQSPYLDPRSAQSTGRTYVICATGLASGLPHFVRWGDAESDHAGWGVVHEGRNSDGSGSISVADAVYASASLPGAGAYESPASDELRSETLIDGGASGIFGDAYITAFAAGPETQKSGYRRPIRSTEYLAVDGGRHQAFAPAMLRTLHRASFIARVMRWVQVGAEAAYVNDLLDLDQDRVIRLCHERYLARDAVQPSLSQRIEKAPTTPVDERLDYLRERTSRLGLLSLNDDTIANAVLTGIVATAQVLTRLDNESERGTGGLSETAVDALIEEIGPELKLEDEMRLAWEMSATATRPPYFPPSGTVFTTHKGVTTTHRPYTLDAYVDAVDPKLGGYTSVQLDVVVRRKVLHVEHAVFGRPIRIPILTPLFWRIRGKTEPKAGPTLDQAVTAMAAKLGPEAGPLRVNIETKTRHALEPLVLFLTTDKTLKQSHIIVSAPFHGRLLRKLRRRIPALATNESLIEGALIGRPISLRKRSRTNTAVGCQLALWLVARYPGAVAAARKRGRSVQIWTVNDLVNANKVQALGAVGVISDAPSVADIQGTKPKPTHDLKTRQEI